MTTNVLIREDFPRIVRAVEQGPAGADGAAGGASYIHNQPVASLSWTIGHNLGFKPVVQLFTVGGIEFQADILHFDLNTVIIYLVLPTAGYARLI